MKSKGDCLIYKDAFCLSVEILKFLKFMDRHIKILVDPLNNQVRLSLDLNNVFVDNGYLDEDLSTVILKPAMIILTENKKHLYHLRSVDWEITILLRSEWKERFWLVTDCFWNPGSDFIGGLIAKGSFVSF